ncbi:sensor histidine kinase inhibitor, KipI family [Brevibacterium iodinum ATCC 49514]|uniref:Sensor histidine kinase inhibitor, KipI family n=1 Tax=Brevibacterium iodinum ATCC 49514 TaxID=1255616 RepID=A0A2H1JXN2_9MICO|nr:carboxyltransferase domain-containing protein [Brevibacterium iodinum]SMX92231.1 sensor histidine kinase inhibitor, KipI family [Brevibacterium iodinum ATCC 49514]SUW13192.1 Sporulation inhibitor kipI [Brevibacterium iodinum]
MTSTPPADSPIFHTASRRHLLVECADLTATMALHRSLEAADLPGVTELIPAARTVLISFDPARTHAEILAEAVRGLGHTESASDAAREVTIDVHYDGDDLAEVADLLSVSPDEVIKRHQAATWQVAFAGFAPGFGYLAGDDELFNVPRRSSPRTRVPVGSVALAGEFTGVYPRSSPGGWELIGRTDAKLWDLDREPPALFVPGTIVKFAEAGRETVEVAGSSARSGASGFSGSPGAEGSESDSAVDSAADSASDSAAAASHALEVLRPGLQLLIQDLGRPGFASMGVSAAGAADRTALTAANRLVGNAETAAGLESFGGAVLLRATGDGVAAVTGATGSITVTAADGTVLTPRLGEAFALADGDELELGPTERGVRRYFAVRGGIAVETALDSSSADTLAGLGPAAVDNGTTVGVHAPRTAPHLVDPNPAQPRDLPQAGETVTLSVTLGPREDWFTEAGIETLLSQEWTVTHESDRVGLRLNGEVPLERARTGELPSEGAVTGALQVPPNGQPVLFGPDHPLTGGYPIIASIDDVDLAAQLPPGVKLRFTTSARPTPNAHSAEASSTAAGPRTNENEG